MARELAFVIHHLNPWGGHDRSTLEIARRISRSLPVAIHAYTLDDPELGTPGRSGWGHFRFRPVRPHLRRPALLMINQFFLSTWWSLRVRPWIERAPRPLVHSTGAASWVSDVVQVQFVQAAWEKRLRDLRRVQGVRGLLNPSRLRDLGGLRERRSLAYQPPSTRSGPAPGRWARVAYHGSLLRYNLWAERRIYRPDKTYIAIARGVARELEEHFGIPSERIHVIHHGVDSRTFRPAETEEDRKDREQLRAALGLAPRELAIGFVGEYERKGLATAISALALLPAGLREHARLVAVGDGDRPGFRRLAREKGVAGQVLLLEPRKDIPRVYRACDVFLLPTLYEPFGLVILEAMASGLGVVVSRLAGAAELIEDGKSGQLIEDPADPREIARALSGVLSDEAFRASLGREARKVAEARSWDRVAEEYQRVMREALDS